MHLLALLLVLLLFAFYISSTKIVSIFSDSSCSNLVWAKINFQNESQLCNTTTCTPILSNQFSYSIQCTSSLIQNISIHSMFVSLNEKEAQFVVLDSYNSSQCEEEHTLLERNVYRTENCIWNGTIESVVNSSNQYSYSYFQCFANTFEQYQSNTCEESNEKKILFQSEELGICKENNANQSMYTKSQCITVIPLPKSASTPLYSSPMISFSAVISSPKPTFSIVKQSSPSFISTLSWIASKGISVLTSNYYASSSPYPIVSSSILPSPSPQKTNPTPVVPSPSIHLQPSIHYSPSTKNSPIISIKTSYKTSPIVTTSTQGIPSKRSISTKPAIVSSNMPPAISSTVEPIPRDTEVGVIFPMNPTSNDLRIVAIVVPIAVSVCVCFGASVVFIGVIIATILIVKRRRNHSKQV